MTPDRLHFFWDYFDVPNAGIADFRGRPHVFHRQFDDDADEWTDRYILRQVDDELFTLARARHDLFRKWLVQFHRGAVLADGQTVLAQDRPRYLELERQIGRRLDAASDRSFIMRADFWRPDLATGDGEVRWSKVTES